MKPKRLSRILLFTALGLLSALTVACDSSSNSSPTTPPGALAVDPFNTATQIEDGGFRIQVRMRVVGGLGALDGAAQRGAALARTCQEGNCVEGPLTHAFGEATCANVLAVPVAGMGLEFGVAWLNGDVVGVDFCIAELAAGLTFETTVMDGSNRSNTITTRCTESAVGLTCGSG